MNLKEVHKWVDGFYGPVKHGMRLSPSEKAMIILDDRVKELENILKEVYPQFYGMLLERWGYHKDRLTSKAAGAKICRKIEKTLGIKESNLWI